MTEKAAKFIEALNKPCEPNEFQQFHNFFRINNRRPLAARISPERLMEIRNRKRGKKS